MPELPPPGRATPRVAHDDIARLYDCYAAVLYRYALVVLADHAQAEDAVQQVFSRLLSARPALDLPEHYLRRAVRNECITLLQRRSASASGPSDGRPLLEGVGGPVDHDERLMLEAALRGLPVDQREVVALKVYEGLTFQEIAELTDAPLNTVASRYRYAIDKLRVVFEAKVK